jgi:hypothetical protein
MGCGQGKSGVVQSILQWGVLARTPVTRVLCRRGSQTARPLMFSCELGDMTKIYVGNLPFSADESQVRALFAQHGTVESVNVIMDRETGRPRGFAFVEMSNADASRAIQGLNGFSMGGRALRVNEAQDRPPGGGGRGPGGGGGGGGGPRRSGGGGGGGGGRY